MADEPLTINNIFGDDGGLAERVTALENLMVTHGHDDRTSSRITATMRSANFQSGVAGWEIKDNGDVEFNTGTFRGSLTVGDNAWHVDVDGNMWWGDYDTYTDAAAANAPSINNNGDIYFTTGTFLGTVTVASISIGVDPDAFHVDTQGNMWVGSATQVGAPAYILKTGDALFNNVTIAGTSTVGGRLATTLGGAIDSNGDLVNDVINAKLDTDSNYIKGSFTFQGSGALDISTDANNGLWISPTGILAKKSGSPTLTITNSGDVTLVGTITATAGYIGGWVINPGYLISPGSGITLNSAMNVISLASGGIIQTSSGGLDRVQLNGTTKQLEFYNTAGSLAGSLRGATSTRATGVVADSDFIVPNNKSFWVTSSAGGATQYGGMTITGSNQFWLTLGTDNTFFIKNNSQASNLFTVDASGNSFTLENGYLLGAGYKGSGATLLPGMRVYVFYTDTINLGALGGTANGQVFYTSIGAFYHGFSSNNSYENMPTNTLWVGMTLETVGTPRVVCRTWNYSSGGFQWGVENFHTAATSLIIRFVAIGY